MLLHEAWVRGAITLPLAMSAVGEIVVQDEKRTAAAAAAAIKSP